MDGSDTNGYTFSRKSSAIFQPSFAELIITASSGTYWPTSGLNRVYISFYFNSLVNIALENKIIQDSLPLEIILSKITYKLFVFVFV